MNYALKPHSKRANNVFVPDIKNTKPFKHKLNDQFPFQAMKVGESFFMINSETTHYERSIAKERVSRYNRCFAVYFVTLKHEDEPKRLEIARIA